MNDIAARKAEIAARIGPTKGLTREEAAFNIRVSPSMFDIMVGDGRMPKPKYINSKPVWDRAAVDLAFENLPDEGGATKAWDKACGLPSRTGRG